MSDFKSCPVCQENSDQCLSCASYVVDGERIYYEKLKDFGATKDHEIRFINRIQKQRVTAFFHNGELYIPSRQGRSVPLAIGLQWDAWQEQQAKIEELEKQLDMMKYINDEQSKNIQNAFKTIEIEQGFKDELQKRIDAVKAIMNEYYTGSFDESAEMAGLISLALRGAND